MPSIVWPENEVRETRATAAKQDVQEQLLSFQRDQAEREQMLAPVPTQREAAPASDPWDFSGLKSTLMPWASGSQPSPQPSKPQPQADPWDFSSLKSTLMPWAPGPAPSGGIPGPELSPNGTPISSPGQMTPAALPTGGQIDNSSREAFVRTAYPYALQAAGGNTALAEQMLATAISEANAGGGKDLAGVGYNFFGQKAQAGEPSLNQATWEQGLSGPYNTTASFRRFENPSEGFASWFRFLEENPRYHGALARYREMGNVDQLWREVNAAGYATDPAWADKVANIRANQVSPVVAGLTEQQAQPPPQARQAEAQQTVVTAGQFARNQGDVGNELGLSWERTLEICGPVAAAAFMRATGRLPGREEAEAMRVAQERGYWQPGRGMGGPGTQAQLLTDLGVANRLEQGVDWQQVAADASRGNPVILNTTGHYFVVEGYDSQTGQYNLGESARFLKASGGRQWFRPEEIPGLGMGTPNATIYLDNPQTPAPSVAAGRVSLNAGPEAAPPSGPAAAPAAGTSTAAGALPPAVAQRWRAQFGRDMTPEEAAELMGVLL